MSCLEVKDNTSLEQFNNKHSKGVWFVWFYAEWCGHCVAMMDSWNKFKKNNKHGVNLAKISHEYVDGVNSNPEVQGYPTILLYKNGQVVDNYQGERSEEAFNNYLGENVAPGENVITKELDFDSGINNTNNTANNVVKLEKPKKKKSKKKKSGKKKKSKRSKSLSELNTNTETKPKKSKKKKSGKKKKSKSKKAKKAASV
jgi:thioredoxin-like negative regulator of GroEL